MVAPVFATVAAAMTAASPNGGADELGQAMASQIVADPVPRVTTIPQHPEVGKSKPVPNSSPGEFQLLPSCSSGPNRRDAR